MKDKGIVALLLILGAIAVGNSYLSATNYYALKNKNAQEHEEIRAQLRKEHETLQISCKRSIEFGPPLGKFFKQYHVLTPKQQRDYEHFLPSKC
jgi:hypothetical protein